MKRYTAKIPYTDELISNAILTLDDISEVKKLCEYLDISIGRYITMIIKRDLKQNKL